MKEKGKAKMLIDDDFDFENDASSNESLNDISNDESEMAKQLVYNNNDHKFDLIMKRIAALEAENTRLQICLNKETSRTKVNKLLIIMRSKFTTAVQKVMILLKMI